MWTRNCRLAKEKVHLMFWVRIEIFFASQIHSRDPLEKLENEIITNVVTLPLSCCYWCAPFHWRTNYQYHFKETWKSKEMWVASTSFICSSSSGGITVPVSKRTFNAYWRSSDSFWRISIFLCVSSLSFRLHITPKYERYSPSTVSACFRFRSCI